MKICICNKVERKTCTQKYGDMWVGVFKQSVKIALQAEVVYQKGMLIRLATVIIIPNCMQYSLKLNTRININYDIASNSAAEIVDLTIYVCSCTCSVD